jgi:hypothetical protein
VRRTIEKVEFYDEEDQCLTEKNDDSDFDQLPIGDGSDPNEIQAAVKIKCYLFIKAPQ